MAQHENNFGAKLAELETITEWFESDTVDLNEALVKFERGMILAAELKHDLQEVENRVTKIKQKFDLPTTVAPLPDNEVTRPSLAEEKSPDLFS